MFELLAGLLLVFGVPLVSLGVSRFIAKKILKNNERERGTRD